MCNSIISVKHVKVKRNRWILWFYTYISTLRIFEIGYYNSECEKDIFNDYSNCYWISMKSTYVNSFDEIFTKERKTVKR